MISATHRTLGLRGVVGGNRGGSVALRTQQHSPVFRQTHKKVRSHGKQLIRHIGRVAIFHLRITPLSRADGVNVIQTAARYAATVLTDHRTGERYDFTKVTGVVYQEIIGPGAGERCWPDRQSLWVAAEQAEKRRDPRVAREYQLALPHELSATQRTFDEVVDAISHADHQVDRSEVVIGTRCGALRIVLGTGAARTLARNRSGIGLKLNTRNSEVWLEQSGACARCCWGGWRAA